MSCGVLLNLRESNLGYSNERNEVELIPFLVIKLSIQVTRIYTCLHIK